jgi:hypothetical protein
MNEMRRLMQSNNTYFMREYSKGVSVVNPTSSTIHGVVLPPGNRYIDLAGNRVGPTVDLLPTSGTVLLHAPKV